jgi:zinc protease
VALVNTLVLDNIGAMQQTMVRDDELTNARQYRVRSIPLEVASIDRIARSLLAWSYKGEPLDQPMVEARYYLSLTAHQVQDAFKQYVRPQHLVQVQH